MKISLKTKNSKTDDQKKQKNAGESQDRNYRKQLQKYSLKRQMRLKMDLNQDQQ